MYKRRRVTAVANLVPRGEFAAHLANGVHTEAVLQADIANAERTLTVIVALAQLV